ncbi:DDE-type integrase/transposase/recombinase [Candidatus Collierbacteria bacterium]|nr:DDE-type integrase/transposase/recombinase [Candidatus Collierbacteria bacterium]
MRLFKLFPRQLVIADRLSRQAQVRLSWFDWYYTHGRNAEATCRQFGLSKSVFYRWKKRFSGKRLKTLEFNPKSRRPHRLRAMTTPLPLVKEVIRIRKEDPLKSKYEIAAELKDRGLTLGTSTIQKIINRYPQLLDLDRKAALRKRKKLHLAKQRANRSLREQSLGSLVQIDTKHLYLTGKKYYLFVAIDCKSRFGLATCYPNISSAAASDFLETVLAGFPFPVTNINTDNGSEYLLHFHQGCEQKQIKHYFSYPYTPKMNGRVERLIKTIQEEFLDYQEDLLPELKDINKKLTAFMDKYNYQRYHQALRYRTPAQYVTNYLRQKGD